MTKRILFLIGVLGGIVCSERSYAQSPYDSACYFPQMGNPQQLDTIYGAQANQSLGENVSHLPPLKGQTYDRLVMQGLPENIPFLTAVETGPSFDLHKRNFIKKYPYIFEMWPNFTVGHFRSPQYTDIITYGNGGEHPRIFWGDDKGEYDSSRYTVLLPYPLGIRHMPSPYVAKLTSDSVDDIVISMNTNNGIKDSSYIALFKGGQHLFDQGKIALWDDTVFWGHAPYGKNFDTLDRFPFYADWRGVGRQDLIAIDYFGNYYYYKNDPPFDLHRLAQSLKYDTLLAIKEWSFYKAFSGLGGGISMQAFPRPKWDHSVDLIAPLPISIAADTGLNNGICIFKGGPDFGSKRLSYNLPDFFLHSPAFYSGDFVGDSWPTIIHNFGDLTGTGNLVLGTGGSKFTYGFTALYVLGKAMDDKIDMFFSQNEGGYGGEDTIHVSSDGRPSYIMGAPAYESPEDQANGIFSKGTVLLLRGADNIPVRLNPNLAVADRNSLDTSRHHILAYPNPCQQSAVLTFDNCSGQKMNLEVMNTSGQKCFHQETPGVDGLQQYSVDLSTLSAGEYIINLSCPMAGWSSSIKVIKTGAAQTPWSFDLKKMVGR